MFKEDITVLAPSFELTALPLLVTSLLLLFLPFNSKYELPKYSCISGVESDLNGPREQPSQQRLQNRRPSVGMHECYIDYRG